MIKRISGETNVQGYAKKASTVFALGDVVAKEASTGLLIKATATTPVARLVGTILRDVLATDSDYADASIVSVDVFRGGTGQFQADVDSGTLTQAMVGDSVDLSDENGIDVTSNAQKAVRIERFVDTSTAIVTFNESEGQGGDSRLVSYSETIAFGDFTDGGGAAGTIALGISIPAGAVFQQSLITDVTGFAGDTSAVTTIGDGSDVDRYNTSTPSVFASADNVSAGAVSGTAYHAAAATPTITVTSDSDFGAVSAGQMTVTLFWYEAA